MVLLDTGTPGTVKKFIVRMSMVIVIDGDCNSGVASSSLTIGILTINFSTGTRSSCVQ